MRIYEKVKAYIDENGYTPSTVAKEAGISIIKFNDILEGKTTLYADDLRAICIALNVSPEVFVQIIKSC